MVKIPHARVVEEVVHGTRIGEQYQVNPRNGNLIVQYLLDLSANSLAAYPSMLYQSSQLKMQRTILASKTADTSLHTTG